MADTQDYAIGQWVTIDTGSFHIRAKVVDVQRGQDSDGNTEITYTLRERPDETGWYSFHAQLF